MHALNPHLSIFNAHYTAVILSVLSHSKFVCAGSFSAIFSCPPGSPAVPNHLKFTFLQCNSSQKGFGKKVSVNLQKA
jgi:hypothetical protein